MSTPPINRREFLTTTALAAGALTLPGCARGTRVSSPGTKQPGATGKAFDFVHLTDMHVTPRRHGDAGYHKCIETVMALKPKPDFAMMGGDLAFDGLYTEKAKFVEQVRIYKEVSDSMGIPYYNCMGNHDALGWSSRRKVELNDPDFGKKYIMDALEWKDPYYSFDHKGWHFAVLDCIYPTKEDHGTGYEARIGDEQLEWLAYDLGSAGDRPKIVTTHIAAYCNIAQQQGSPDSPGMPAWAVVRDTLKLQQILERHGVKALLQGHTHRPEEYRWHDVWYITSPAVSGAWWAGDFSGSAPGYTIFHCGADGELTWDFNMYGWEAQLDPEDETERKRNAEKLAADREQARLRDMERAGR
ncbi:MAG: metallophosphoesterase [Phycisphaerales bacterium]